MDEKPETESRSSALVRLWLTLRGVLKAKAKAEHEKGQTESRKRAIEGAMATQAVNSIVAAFNRGRETGKRLTAKRQQRKSTREEALHRGIDRLLREEPGTKKTGPDVVAGLRAHLHYFEREKLPYPKLEYLEKKVRAYLKTLSSE